MWIFFQNLHRSLEFLSPKEELKQNREIDRMEKARGEEKGWQMGAFGVFPVEKSEKIGLLILITLGCNLHPVFFWCWFSFLHPVYVI